MSILKWFRRKPEALVIQDKLGTFLLEHPQSDRFYEGTVPWPPEEALVDLEIDGGEPPAADAALAHLCGIMAEAGEWDRRLRAYAADEMAGGDGWIETWEDEDSGGSRRTREEFIRRLSIGFIRVTTIWTGCSQTTAWEFTRISPVKFFPMKYADRAAIFTLL